MLFILDWLPGWIYTLLFFLGIVVYLVTSTLKIIPAQYTIPIKYLSIIIIFIATYFSGAKATHEAWHQKTAALEKKVAELELKSAKTNVEVVTKVITNKQIIKEKGQDIIHYVDREVVKDPEVIKYLESCPKLPQNIVDSINKAAKQ